MRKGTYQLTLLAVAFCLGACAHASPSLVVPERISYTVSRPSETRFVFEDYLAYAQGLADKWDDHARLHSISRLTHCDAYEQVSGQKLLVRFWRPVQYWFGERIEWFEVIERPEDLDTTIRVWTPGNSTWDKPPIDLASVKVSYTEALQQSFKRGGAEFMATHSSCHLAAELDAGRWLFVYYQDRCQDPGGLLRLCIHAQTGEPCEFPDFALPKP